MQLKATKLAAILSRLHSALRVPSALALFAALGLALAAPQTAQAGNWYKFTILGVRKTSGSSTQQLENFDTSFSLSAIALYDGSGNLVSVSSPSATHGTAPLALFDGSASAYASNDHRWLANNIDKVSTKTPSVSFLVPDGVEIASYKIATSDNVGPSGSVNCRVVTSWKLEKSNDGTNGSSWSIVDKRAYDDGDAVVPLSSGAWYNSGNRFSVATDSLDNYTLLEYIHSSGSTAATGPYIQISGFNLNGDNVVNTKFAFDDVSENVRNDAVFVNRTLNAAIFSLFRIRNISPTGLRLDYSGTSHSAAGSTPVASCMDKDTHIIRCYASGISLDGSTPLSGSKPSSAAYTESVGNASGLLLFACDNPASCNGVADENFTAGKMYHFAVEKSETDPTLRLNLIPVKRKSDDKYGMYDTVGNKFYAATGTFDGEPVQTQYVCLNITKRNVASTTDSTSIQLSELALYDANDDRINFKLVNVDGVDTLKVTPNSCYAIPSSGWMTIYGDEHTSSLFDGSLDTKFCGSAEVKTEDIDVKIYMNLGTDSKISSYKLASANDTSSNQYRAPKAWTLSVSSDGVNWTTIDERTAASGDAALTSNKTWYNSGNAYTTSYPSDIPSVSTLTVTLSGASATYTGSSVEPNITITDAGGTTLFSAVKASAVTGRGFTAQWKKGGSAASVQNAGTYTLTLTGDGATYSGTAEKGTFTVDKKMATTPVAVVTTYTGSTQDAPIKDASGNNLKGSIWDYASTGSGAQQSGKGEHTVKVQLHDANNYTYTDGATTTTFKWTITDVKCTCSTYSSWTAGENNILRDKVAEVTGYGVGNENTAGVAVLTDGANPISSTNPTNAERCELKGNGETTLTWDLGGQATVSELRVFVGVGDTSWGHANINITKLEYYDATAGAWKELKFFAQTMPYYANNTKQVKAVISRDNGNLFENATQLRLTMYAPITIPEAGAYYSSLTEIEAIGEVHATPIPEANLPRLNPARTFKFDNTDKTVSLSDDTYVQIVSGDGTGTATAKAAGVYYVWVQPKAGYVWPDDESSAPRKYEWGIVPSGYTESRNFLKTLENSPYRVAAPALPPGITGGDIFLRFPNSDGLSYDFVHVYTNTAASGFVFENDSGIPRQGRVLIVGGGGASGYTMGQTGTRAGHITGGGGGGGGVRSLRDLQLDGVYSILVGQGGIPVEQGARGVNGSASRFQYGSISYAAAGGGGGGKSSSTSGDSASNGLPGASGGGGAGTNGTGGAGDGDGYVGGGANAYHPSDAWSPGCYMGAGGGGAGRSGFAGCGEGESGGYGFLTDILASPGVVSQYICLGGGGAGGGDGEQHHSRTLGGFGGGGNSYVNETENNGETGVNGLGGGAGADSMSASGPFSGNGSSKRGGDGIVIVRYTDTVQAPKIKVVPVPQIQNTYIFDYARHDVLLKDSTEKLADTEDYTVSGDFGGINIQEYTVTLTLRDPANMQWDNGESQPQDLKWSITHDILDDRGSFLSSVAASPLRVKTDPSGAGADIILRERVTRDSAEWYRYTLVYANSANVTFSANIPDARILLVGGGGGGGTRTGGSNGGGGGGGGGVLYMESGVSFSAGEYAMTVGAGGATGTIGGDTTITKSSTVLHRAGGGGGGGTGGSAGKAAALGSGGGAGGNNTTGGNGGDQGNAGGAGSTSSWTHRGGGGGGGAKSGGGSTTYDDGGSGGAGLGVSILPGFENQPFGGGGAGGWGESASTSPSYGGAGGGGNSYARFNLGKYNQTGMDGLGGGGAGGSAGGNGEPNATGRSGGSGLIVISYERLVGTFIDKPTLASDRFTYSGEEVGIMDHLTSKEHMTGSGTLQAENVGDYQFSVAPASGYQWSDGGTDAVSFDWSIAAKPIQGNITVSPIPAQTYTGSPITPVPTVRDTARNVVLTLGTDYTVEYFANVNIGTATIKLTGTGNYTATANTTFQIVANPNEVSYYVTAEATDEGEGTGWDAPTSLKTAFERASALTDTTKPCTIYVKAGTYKNSSGPWTLSSGIKTMNILGGYTGIGLARGTERTVLDGESARSLLSFGLQSGSDNWSRIVRFNQVDFVNAVEAIVGNAGKDSSCWCQIAFESCRFTGNKTSTAGHGAVLWINPSTIQIMPIFRQCEIRGNCATVAGAYILHGGQRGRDYIGTAFVGNSGVSAPLFWLQSWQNNPLTIRNCTFAYNAISETLPGDKALVVGGGSAGVSWTSVSNTICACNSDANGSSGHRVIDLNGAVTYDYVLLGEGDTCQERTGDIGRNTITNGDPLFAAGTLTPTFGGTAGVATWKNAAGKTVDPVDIDVHVKSVMGRWDGSAWVNDSVTSPAIDAGNPENEYSLEPTPNGGRVNLGAYGNTAEASKSYDVTEEAAILSGAMGFSEIKQLDNGHTVLIYSNVTDAASFTVAEGGVARILVVGGGGKGGNAGAGYGGGGGGAGGVVERSAVMLAAGTYTVVVGGSSQDSVLKDSSGTALITAYQGGTGGVLRVQGGNGGSGGGGGPQGGGAGGHVQGQGNNGGGADYYAPGGGGGYGSVGRGGSGTTSGIGGNGYVSDITGELKGYACGGGGGKAGAGDLQGAKGGYVTIDGEDVYLGGDGGTSTDGYKGVDGTGSGGGGGGGFSSGGAGGSGIVVVHLYTKWDIGVVTFDANGGTGGPGAMALANGEALPTLTQLPAHTGYTFGGYARKWWEVTKLTGNETDILTEGTGKWAYCAYAGYSLNGVSFVAQLISGETTLGNLTLSAPFAAADNDGMGSDDAREGTALNSAYACLMVCKARMDESDKELTLTLNNLTEGKAYLVQILYHGGNNPTARSKTLSVDNENFYNCEKGAGENSNRFGWSFVRRFVAAGSSEDIKLYASAYLQVNAIQLREIPLGSVLYYDKDGAPAKDTWDVDGDETLYAIWNRGTMYKLGVDDGNQSSWSKSYSGSVGWAASRDGSVDASHLVSSMYDYVVVSGCRLRTLTSHASDPNTPLKFGGHSLCLEGPLALKLGNNQDQNALEYLRIDRLIGAGGSIELSSYCKTTLTGESITINDDSALKIYVDANKARHLYVKPPISGAGDLILWLGNSTSTSDRYNTILTLEGDNSGFTGAIKAIQPDDWAGFNPSQYDFYVMNNFGGTVESLPDLASCGVTNYVHFKYDGLVGDRGLRISTNEFSSVIKERIVLYSDETDFDAPNLPLMTFPEGTAVDPAAFTVRHAAGTNGTGTAFIQLKTITNGDGTITLVANGDMSSEPAHFQRVESIHSTGAQYLNTGYVPTAKTWMEARLAFEGAGVTAGMNDAQASVFGTWNSTATGAPRGNANTYAGHFAASDNVRFVYESGAANGTGLNDVSTVLSDMTLVVQKTGVTVGTATATGADHAGTAAFPLYLFGCNAGGMVYAFGKFPQMSVRSWKIYESDTGTKGGANERLVRDFVPVIDTFENNRPGLYDRVEGKFYPSETGTDFVAGAATEPAAYFGGKAKASISDAEGYSQVLQVANDHTVLVFANTNAPGSFTVSEGGVARVLVIGGGGAGGDGATSPAGGGGGAGAMIEEYDLSLAVGATYTVTVGAGGAGADTDGLSGNDGDDSSLKCGEEPVIVAYGGGGGGGMNDGQGHSGGSGGGSSCVASGKFGRAINPRYGHDGGDSTGWALTGGGGGAGSPGQGATSGYQANVKGGAGLANDITGSWVTYAAGGEGWGGERSGLDGTGSGGNGSAKSCAGGSGVVIVHLYTKWAVATVTLDHNDGTGESDSVFVKAGAPMPTLITIPERHSYAFAGYFDAVTGGTQYYTAAGASARDWDKDGDATLYAHWEIDLPPEYDQLDCLDNGSDSSKAGFVCVDFQLQPDHVVRTKYEYNTDPTDTDFGTVFMSIAYYSEDGNLRYGLARQASAKAAFCYGVRTMSTGQGGYKELPGSASKGVHEVVCQQGGAQEIAPTPGTSTGPTGGTIDENALPERFFIMAKPPESRVCDKSPYALDGTLNGCGLIKMYYLTVTNASGAVLLDLVPAKRTSDNAEGLYDLVGGKFYPLRKPCGAASPADPNRCAAHEVGEWHDQSATDDACGWHCGMCTNCMRVIRQMIPAIQARRSWPWDGENHRPTIDGANGQCKLTGCDISYSPGTAWTDVGQSYSVTLTPATGHTWTDGTTTNVIYNYAITEPEFHVMRADGPLIDVKKAAWLDLVYGNDKTHEYYQAALFETNRQGVVAWQAYVLGFEASKDAVNGAAIVEETVQNADPATVTIRLANMPPLREGTGCTVKYSLYAATSTEDLMNDRGTVVTNDTDTTNVKVYEKCHESTFEAPLDDLTENEPVRYYRIKVHFTFGGGSGGGEDEPKATVFYAYLDTVDPDALPSGWTKDAPGSGKDNEYYVRTGPIDIPEACLEDGYVRVSFKTTVKYNGGYFTLTFLDENGAELSNIDALKVAVDSLATAENGQLVTKVYRVPAGANVQKIHMQWADSNSARGKGDPQSFADVVVSNIKVESLNYLAAASEVDAIFGESVDSTAYATAKATYFDARSANVDWTRGLQGLHDALVNGGDYNILVMGDSLAEAPFNGALEALIKRQWPQSNVRVHVCWNGNSGCTQFAGSGYTQQQTVAEDKYKTLLEHGFAGYNCVIFSGTSQARCANSWSGLSGAITTINNAIKEKNPNCSVVFLAPQLSVDTRYFKPWNTSEGAVNPGDGYWLTEDYYYPGYGQPCASRADWSLSTDKWAPIDYSKFGSEISTLAGGLGMAYWDLYEFAYDYLFRSGKPYFYYSRDAQHANEYNRVLSAKQLLEVFKLVAAKDFTTP